MAQYHVDTFVPPAPGCNDKRKSSGWDQKGCEAYAAFLNHYAQHGWRLHSADVRTMTTAGCSGPQHATLLVCVFEKP